MNTGRRGIGPSFAGPPTEAFPGVSHLRAIGRGKKVYDVYWALAGEGTLPLEGSEIKAVHSHSYPRTFRIGNAAELQIDEAPVFIER